MWRITIFVTLRSYLKELPGQGEPNKPLHNREQGSKLSDILGAYPTWDLEQTEKIIKRAGWNNVAEFLVDVSGYFITKPLNPAIPKDDIKTLDHDSLLAANADANSREEEVVDWLERERYSHLVEPFKKDMQEYRKGVKAIVQWWRKRGLL